MKLMAAGAGLSELAVCLEQGLCAGVLVDAVALAAEAAPGAALGALCAPERLVFVELAAGVRDADAIVLAARDLASIGRSIVVRVPFGGAALAALKACAAAGVTTNAVGCATAIEAHAAAQAGAAWISPVVPSPEEAAAPGVLDAIRKMNALLKADDLTARMLVGPVHARGALVDLALVGAHAALTSPAVLREIASRRPGGDGLPSGAPKSAAEA